MGWPFPMLKKLSDNVFACFKIFFSDVYSYFERYRYVIVNSQRVVHPGDRPRTLHYKIETRLWVYDEIRWAFRLMRFLYKSCYMQRSCGRRAWEARLNVRRCVNVQHKQETNTRLTAFCPGLSRWAGTRKIKPICMLLKQETASGSGIIWAICKSAPRSRQITMPAPHRSVCYRPDALPATQPTASKHWRHKTFNRLNNFIDFDRGRSVMDRWKELLRNCCAFTHSVVR